MREKQFKEIETYMLSCMTDSAHDKEHIYRVLYAALDIAKQEDSVDYDVLIAACLLHDIGRNEQFENPALSHALVGAGKAYRFLLENGYSDAFAVKVKACVETHRYRADRPPESIEAKILFDADKVDVTGAIGIARTIFYEGHFGEPLYSLLPDGRVSDGTKDSAPSFFREYKFKLENLYDKFYTKRGTALADERKAAAEAFYRSLLNEVSSSYEEGPKLLDGIIESN